MCEGQVTERQYLEGLRVWCRNPRVEIEVSKEHGVPLTTVQIAVRLKRQAELRAKAERDDNLLFDEVWCAYDVDEHPNMNDARQLAAANGINLAVSNPCIELWVVLHFRESPGPRHRHDVQRLLGTFLPGYDKHLDMARVLPGYDAARTRAARLQGDAEAVGEGGRNPTTGMYHLTESIRNGAPE